MRDGRKARGSRGRGVLFLFVAGFFLAFLPAKPSRGALITGNYELSWEQDVEKTGAETTDVRKFKQTLELKYKGFLSPLVENEVTLEVEQEINSNAPDTTRFLPTLDLGLKGRFWDGKMGIKRTQENSDDPAEPPKVTTNYFVEFFYLAPRFVPDLKVKYTLDTDEEEGVTDTEKDELTLSSVYSPTEWLDLKGEYSRTNDEDNLNPDSDTEEREISASVGIRHFFSKKIKLNAQYDVELTRGATLLDAGGITNPKEDQTHTVKSKLAYRPFVDTEFEGSYDFDLKQDMILGEHTHTTNGRVTATQKIGKFFDIKGEFSRDITEEKHTADDNEQTEDTWTVDFKAKFSKMFDFSVKYEIKDLEEIHVDPSLDTTTDTVTWEATWSGELTPFWEASLSYDRTKDSEDERTTLIETRYDLDSTFDFKAINLTLEPSYEITKKEDFEITPAEESEIRDFQFKIAWKAFSTRTIEGKFDHTYGRKTDTGAGNIQRTDDTNVNITWKEGFPGWIFGFDLTRSATDTSEDDLEPDITSTFGFKADYSYEMLTFSSTFKYDKKSTTADSETLDVKLGWTAPKWDAELSYSFDKTLSAEIDEGYSITLVFQYNL